MKKAFNFAALAFAAMILVLGLTVHKADARLHGTDPGTDIWCMGPDGAEVCVDTSGNIIPTTTNDTSLGTSALRYSNLYTTLLNVSGASTLTGSVAVGGITNTGPTQLAVATTAQLMLRSDPIGSTYLVAEYEAGVLNTTKFASCVSTVAATYSYVYLSTNTVASLGTACNK